MTQLKTRQQVANEIDVSREILPYSSQAQSMRCFMSLIVMLLALK